MSSFSVFQRRATQAARALILAVAVVATAFALIGYVGWAREPGRAGPLTSPVDFNAFYCSGKVLWSGGDPYRAEPLGACERAAYLESELHAYAGEVVPAPLPPAVLGAFGALGALSFRDAALVWFALLIAATAIAAYATTRASGMRGIVVAPLVFGAVLVPAILVGQVAPLGIASLAFAGASLARGRDVSAAIALGVATCVPQLALPAIVAVALYRPSARFPLGVAMAALATASLAAGPALDLEYVARVLPLHALAEATDFASQFGLSAIAAALGVSTRLSLALGVFSYLTLCGVGVIASGALARRYGSAVPLAVVPPVFAVSFGEYVHVHHISVAVVAALWLAGCGPRRIRPWAFAAACVVALPFQSVAEAMGGDAPRRNVPDPRPALLAADRPTDYADEVNAVWTRFKAARNPLTPLEQTAVKLPYWLALLTLVGASSALAGHAVGHDFMRRRRATVRIAASPADTR
jgi:hypothetical protein